MAPGASLTAVATKPKLLQQPQLQTATEDSFAEDTVTVDIATQDTKTQLQLKLQLTHSQENMHDGRWHRKYR